MSGFSPEWLALREPADHASINACVRRALVAALAGRARLDIVDLGCGTGSNLRGLWPWLSRGQRWTLVDYDAHLLAVANARTEAEMPGAAVSYRQADFSKGDFAPIIGGAGLVTAAALFDLASDSVIGGLAAAVAANRQIFATVLTYDGIAAFLPEHPLDQAMRLAFNAHQLTDKGFGAAAGPGATDALTTAFLRYGYQIVRGKSPWVLDRTFERLRRELDQGWANAVRETGQLPSRDIDSWIAHRLAAKDAVSIVGHEDLLALPA